MGTATDRLQHIKAWQTSGLTQAAYCRHHGLNPTTFSGWRRRYRAVPEGAIPGLLPIQLTLTTTGPTGPLVLRLASGHALELPADAAPGWLAELLRCLG
jgi:transposase-like protein